MNAGWTGLLRLSWTYLWSRPLATVLNLMLLSVGIASITLVVLLSEQVEAAFDRDLKGIDVVVGAKGSPIQLILSGVFHIDVPPGNMALADVKQLQAQPQVAQLIPLSLGDSFGGWRIVGTTHDYVAHYGATLAQGTLWSGPMQAVVGAQVAQRTGLALGQRFVGTHGLGGSGEAHSQAPFVVSGVLKHCGCVLDRLVLTASESVWLLHEKAMAQDEADRKALQAEREVTMVLIRYRSPLAAVTFPRWVNAATSLQAAAPAVEVTRLLRLLGAGTEVLRGFGAVLLAAAGLSVFIALWSAVRERRSDLAMLRMLGAPPRRIAGLLVCEALWLAAMACVAGLLLGHMLTGGVGLLLDAQRSLAVTAWWWSPAEAAVVAGAVGVAVLAALIPSASAYHADPGVLLQSR
ncbi:MAG: ABC transporter permease [Burkholderiaceae bacterium]